MAEILQVNKSSWLKREIGPLVYVHGVKVSEIDTQKEGLNNLCHGEINCISQERFLDDSRLS